MHQREKRRQWLASVAVGLVSLACDRIVQSYGFSRDELLAGVELDPELLSDPDSLIDMSTLVELLRWTQRRTRDPGMGLRLAHLVDLRQQGFWGYAVLSSGGLQCVVRRRDALGFEFADIDEDGATDIVTTRAQRLFALLARGDGAFEARDLGVDIAAPSVRDFVVDPGHGSAPAQLYTLNGLTSCSDCSSRCTRCLFGACTQCLSDADCNHSRCEGHNCI